MTRAKMSDAKLADLPEDILEGIFCLVAEDCFKGDDGFKQWCQLAAELPRLSTLLLPRAPLKQLTRRDLPWEGEYELSETTLRKLIEAGQPWIAGNICIVQESSGPCCGSRRLPFYTSPFRREAAKSAF